MAKIEVSVIIPAKNEAMGLKSFLPALRQAYPTFEIIVVNDGSSDETALIAKTAGARVISHPYSIGNGACLKTGARAAQGKTLLFMDGDGQHQVQAIAPLLAKYQQGYDMVVGARDRQAQASTLRWLGNCFYNKLASFIVHHPVQDLTSGMRIVNAQKFKEFLHLLPNGFSAPSTITMAFFRAGYFVAYEPIPVQQRIGQSHLKPFTDGIRFLIIIYKMAILYSPLKVFLPIASLFFLAGIGNYAHTYFTQGRFTNMSVVLFSTAIIIFLIGLISEQITLLMYFNAKSEKPKKPKRKKYALPAGKSTVTNKVKN